MKLLYVLEVNIVIKDLEPLLGMAKRLGAYVSGLNQLADILLVTDMKYFLLYTIVIPLECLPILMMQMEK